MKFDAIVIGGGFAGLSAAMQIARGRRTVCVVDTGEPRNRFAEASHGFFGRDGAAPLEMITEARAKLAAYPSVAFRSEEAVGARPRERGGFEVKLATGEKISGTKLVLAVGVKDALPEIPGLQERWGKTVLHCPYCHGYEFGGARLGVLNVMPMSLHQALLIPEWGPTTFFLNGAESPDAQAARNLRARNVTIEPAPIEALVGDTPGLEGVRLADGRVIQVTALFVAPRTQVHPIAAELGCELEDGPLGKVIRTDEWKLTSVPGVYAAGDAARAQHNATLASADGVLAGTALHRALVFEPLEQGAD